MFMELQVTKIEPDRVYAGSVEPGREVLYVHIPRRRDGYHRDPVACYFSGLIFNTFPLYTCQDLLEDQIKRGWIERLFTRPWKPLKKYNTKYQRGVILKWMAGKNVLVAHPLTTARLLREAYDPEHNTTDAP
jgi:hypothetical protein